MGGRSISKTWSATGHSTCNQNAGRKPDASAKALFADKPLNRVAHYLADRALTYPDSCVTDLDIPGSHEYGVQVHLLNFLMFFNET